MGDTADAVAFSKRTPEGDNRERDVCDRCGFIDYRNPKIVSGAVCVHADGRLLLCKRAIEPRSGYWTIPAGFLEQHEAPDEGARREVREEACATIEIDALLAIYTVRHLSQVQLFYRAKMVGDDFGVGDESADAMLCHFDDIPWQELAFPTVTWALKHYAETRTQETPRPMVKTATL